MQSPMKSAQAPGSEELSREVEGSALGSVAAESGAGEVDEEVEGGDEEGKGGDEKDSI